MDWNSAVLDSLIWLGLTFSISAVFITISVWLFTRYSGWGRQYWRLVGAYFSPRRDWRPLAKLSVILLLTLFGVRMNVLFSFWYNGFYSALQELDGTLVWMFLGLFGVLATIHVVRALAAYYLEQAFTIYWRVWLNDEVLNKWLNNQAYYRGQQLAGLADNPDQRIQQDVNSFVTTSMTLATGLVSAVVSIFAFTLILWGLSGSLTIADITIPRAMVFLVYLYVAIASVFAFKIGRPLIKLNFLNEKFNASYRYALIRLREYGESIAFYRGEKVESKTLGHRFSDVISNAWAIVFRTLKLTGFNLSIAQAAVVFPFVVQLPRYLSKQIALGDVMQTGNAFNQVQDSLSFFRDSYESFAEFRAVIERLIGFLDAVEAVNTLPHKVIESESSSVNLSGVTIRKPDNELLVENLTLDMSVHQPLLIRGQSGVGKTTLLRTIAGLWPYADGEIAHPRTGTSLFLSQKPYLPLGTLRQALYYPRDLQKGDDAALVLKSVQLGHLVKRLDDAEDWSQILSLGEQQRLAFGRVILNAPQILFLDEATSAMDEGLEESMYRLLQDQLPQMQMISIGHRSTLKPFHKYELDLLGGGAWKVSSIVVG